jgi:hypothetical protein
LSQQSGVQHAPCRGCTLPIMMEQAGAAGAPADVQGGRPFMHRGGGGSSHGRSTGRSRGRGRGVESHPRLVTDS